MTFGGVRTKLLFLHRSRSSFSLCVLARLGKVDFVFDHVVEVDAAHRQVAHRQVQFLSTPNVLVLFFDHF